MSRRNVRARATRCTRYNELAICRATAWSNECDVRIRRGAYEALVALGGCEGKVQSSACIDVTSAEIAQERGGAPVAIVQHLREGAAAEEAIGRGPATEGVPPHGAQTQGDCAVAKMTRR